MEISLGMIKMTSEKQDNIIFMEGKAVGLKMLFNQEHFGYLAVGHVDNDNGFINPESDSVSNGFNEISLTEDSTYHRVPLTIHSDPILNTDNGRVTVKFTAELDIDNIISGISINQLAIVDSETAHDPNTIFYAAATCANYDKNETLALVFEISMTI